MFQLKTTADIKLVRAALSMMRSRERAQLRRIQRGKGPRSPSEQEALIAHIETLRDRVHQHITGGR